MSDLKDSTDSTNPPSFREENQPTELRLPEPGWGGEIPLAIRRIVFFSTAALIATTGTIFFADLLYRIYGAFQAPTILLTVFFAILFSMVSFGFVHAFFGFFAMPFRSLNITSRLKPEDQFIPIDLTAVVFPVYNEPVDRVFEGLRAVYLSVQKTGRLENFEFFILSDSTSVNNWIREEEAWSRICRELGAFGRIFYRRRTQNVNKKAGNIADFCRTWGGRYTYMIVMDADSVMQGPDMVNLAILMQKNPRIGIIQTAPRLIGAESLYGRCQQFANRIYGPMFTAGLNFWQESEGNYWGHNAIIRVQPFTDHCDLPDLPGKEPFGGKILSHDFVEAALMRKAGWEVWLAWDLEGSFEEGPQSLIESAQRDRRWLQGNLQHSWLLFAKGLHPASKIHLAMGILGYLASPFWLAFLLAGMLVVHRHNLTGLSVIPADGVFGRWFPWLTPTTHGIFLFLGTMAILFAPKFFAVLQALLCSGFRKSMGGLRAICTGMLIETIGSTLIAPSLMLFHTKFLLWMFLGKSVNWGPQVRGAKGTSWGQATRAHLSQTIIGVGWATLAIHIDQRMFFWMIPIFAGLIFAIPLSVFSSRASAGEAFAKMKLLLNSEDIQQPWEMSEIERRLLLAEERKDEHVVDLAPFEGLSRAIVDPYLNAIHVSLQEGYDHKPNRLDCEALATRLAQNGPNSLTIEEIKTLLADPESVLHLHRQIWTTPFAELDPWWQRVTYAYRRS